MDGLPELSPAELVADQGPKVVVIAAIVYALAVVAVGLRFLSRRIARCGLQADDWLILGAVTLSLSSLILSILLVQSGLGRHVQALSMKDIQTSLQMSASYFVLYVVIIATVKYSILFFYWRIFHLPSFKVPLYIMGVIITAWAIASIMVILMECIPLRALWDFTVKGHCISTNKTFLGNAIPNVITDAILLAMPLPFLFGLHVSRSQKVALVGIFALAGFTTIISILRLLSAVEVQGAALDFTWNRVSFAIWTVVELNIGIVCACLPSMRPILTALMTGSLEGSKRNPSAKRPSYGDSSRFSSRAFSRQKASQDPLSTDPGNFSILKEETVTVERDLTMPMQDRYGGTRKKRADFEMGEFA